MANPGQSTIRSGATGDAVKRLQRALRRTPRLDVAVDGVFGPALEQAVRDFQQAEGLPVDGVVGTRTWAALPNGGPMPTIRQGDASAAVTSLQRVLTNGAPGAWNVTPGAIDGRFGAKTRAAVEAFQAWGKVNADGVVGDQTWAVSLGATNSTLETAVGLIFVAG